LDQHQLPAIKKTSIAEEAITDHSSRFEAFPYFWREKPPRTTASEAAFMESSLVEERRQNLLVRATEPEVVHHHFCMEILFLFLNFWCTRIQNP
jgi:hypothetical protein